MANLSMADLLAKQSASLRTKSLSLSRGQEVEGIVVAILPTELILDLGTKAEGVLSKKELDGNTLSSLKIGDKLSAFVIYPENESGQTVLALQRAVKGIKSDRFQKFTTAQKENKVLIGKGVEVNKGGLVVEVDRIRGFLPASQVGLSQAAQLDNLVGKEISVMVIEVDPGQNRLIFSQKANISEEIKNKLNSLKPGEAVTGQVAAVLPFGIFVSLEGPVLSGPARNAPPSDAGGVEGLVHISEISWEKIEDPSSQFRIGQKVSAKVISTDQSSGRVNLSIKQLYPDPFTEKVKGLSPSDVVKGVVTKVAISGVFVDLGDGVEGLIASSKIKDLTDYQLGQELTCLVDSIDAQKRRVNLAPFITTTKGLIYK